MSSRAASKSRAEKSKVAQNVPTPNAVYEIVPGKLNENDWHSLTDQEENDAFILEIIEEMVDATINQCYEVYLQKQEIPFAVNKAREQMLKIIQWEFMPKDPGDTEAALNDISVEEEQPQTSVMDSWAQGCVPTRYIPDRSYSPANQEVFVKQSDDRQENEALGNDIEALSRKPSILLEALKTMTPIEEVQEPLVTSAPPSVVEPSDEKKLPKARKKVSRTKKITHEEQEEDKQDVVMGLSALKLQAGRPPGEKDVLYDDAGNVISVRKLKPTEMPTHEIRPKFQIVNPEAEAEIAALEAMRKGKVLIPHPPNTKAKGKKFHKETFPANRELNPNDINLPPPLFESVNVTPGVVIREGDRTKRGPVKKPRKSEILTQIEVAKLKPVALFKAGPRLQSNELLLGQARVQKGLCVESSHDSNLMERPLGSV